MTILEEIRADALGAFFLHDWLGDGGHVVASPEADARAAVCLSCRHHGQPNWWDRHAKEPIANAIMRELQLKNRMQLVTHHDHALGMCKVCGCCSKLKVWATMDHIKSHTPADIMKKFPDHCWIKKG